MFDRTVPSKKLDCQAPSHGYVAPHGLAGNNGPRHRGDDGGGVCMAQDASAAIQFSAGHSLWMRTTGIGIRPCTVNRSAGSEGRASGSNRQIEMRTALEQSVDVSYSLDARCHVQS